MKARVQLVVTSSALTFQEKYPYVLKQKSGLYGEEHIKSVLRDCFATPAKLHHIFRCHRKKYTSCTFMTKIA